MSQNRFEIRGPRSRSLSTTVRSIVMVSFSAAALLVAAGCAAPSSRPPIAVAGPDQSVGVEVTVQLDGTGSSSPDGGSLTFAWTMSSRPPTSTAALTNATTAEPSFVTDVVGEYVATLTVAEGGRTASDSVRITADALGVRLSTPSTDAFTNGTITLQAAVTGGVATTVDLLVNDDVLATLTSPFLFLWDTTAEPEGAYELRARATFDGQSVTSTPRVVTVDRTAPVVVGRTPNAGSEDVSVDALFEVTFSEPVLANTVGNDSVTVADVGGTELAKTLTLAPDALSLRVDLLSVPNVPNSLTITLTSAITDRAGNALALPTGAWSFELPAWFDVGGALSAHAGSTDAGRPSLAISDAGVPTVAWSESDGIAVGVHVRRWTGTAWSTLGSPVSAKAGMDIFAPSLALDDAGNPVVAWTEVGKGEVYIHVQRWTGRAWEPLGGALSAGTGSTDAGPPSLRLDGTGNPLVAWHERDGATNVFNIYVRRWTGTAWASFGDALSARTGTTHALRPSLEVDGNGQPLVAWEEQETEAGTFHVRVHRWTGSDWLGVGGFLSSVVGDTPAGFASLAVSSTGDPVVAWDEGAPQAAWDVYVRQRTAGSWNALGPKQTAHPDDPDAQVPSLRLDGDDVPVLAWEEHQNVYVRRWNGTDWTALGDAVDRAGTVARGVVLALDANGIPWVAFMADGDVQVRKYNQ
ncbi:MAG: Ig-like domain-containing protein [Trueperaceae bacterium]